MRLGHFCPFPGLEPTTMHCVGHILISNGALNTAHCSSYSCLLQDTVIPSSIHIPQVHNAGPFHIQSGRGHLFQTCCLNRLNSIKIVLNCVCQGPRTHRYPILPGDLVHRNQMYRAACNPDSVLSVLNLHTQEAILLPLWSIPDNFLFTNVISCGMIGYK